MHQSPEETSKGPRYPLWTHRDICSVQDGLYLNRESVMEVNRFTALRRVDCCHAMFKLHANYARVQLGDIAISS